MFSSTSALALELTDEMIKARVVELLDKYQLRYTGLVAVTASRSHQPWQTGRSGGERH